MEVQIAELYSFIWYFIFYSFFGWCCEVVFCSINTGKFVNRGFLNGPLCPIYGFGAVTILYTLQPLENNLLLLFLGSALLCSLLELVAGYLLKTLFHASWWNYSDQPLNLGGYICLKFSLLWGAGCVILVHLIHPAVQVLIKNIPLNVCYVLLVAFYSILVFDLILTIIEIAKLNHDLREITRLSESMRKPSDALAKTLGTSAITVASKIETKLESIDPKDRMEELLKRTTPTRNRLLSAFPKLKSSRYHEALVRLRQRHDNSSGKNR